MYDIYILGAGFSKPAGLPLGNELFRKIIKESKKNDLYKNILKKDIRRYLYYFNKVNNKTIIENDINFEEFISYLDIEHYLALKGKDTWSNEGNRSQIVIRNLIAKVIHDFQVKMNNKKYELYLKFVDKLDLSDIIITFNYDTILETALKRINKPFRYFLNRLSSVSNSSGIIDNTNEEIVLLKMHGSINWFDISNFNRNYDNLKKIRSFNYQNI